jgi:SET domain-containing protein
VSPATDPQARGPEPHVSIRRTETKGEGAFAEEDVAEGRWVGAYTGELLTLLETRQRYDEAPPEYLFQLTPDLYVDGRASGHFTRYINHAERGNLRFEADPATRRVDFFAACAIPAGTELSFDYGRDYWIRRGMRPDPSTDSRDYDGILR